MSRMSQLKTDLIRFGREYFVYLMPSAFIVYLVLESYQIDFRPYYVAGKSVLYGLDPYFNHVNQHPEFYTPVNASSSPTSGWIYPPFASLLFAPLALLPYGNAKVVYSVIILVVLWLLFFELIKNTQFKAKGETILFGLMSFPVLAAFERGQIDILVCYITILSFLIYKRNAQRVLPSFLLAIACCIKLFPCVAILYYLVKREFKLAAYTIGFIALLIIAPLAHFGTSIYTSYLKRIFPQFFGAITSAIPISTHGQDVINRVVMSIDSRGLRVTHDFVHGYMNPFLRNNPIGSLTVGTIAFFILMYYLRRAEIDHQFFSIVNCINLLNPQTWIMGLVWYIPLFVYLFNRANHLGRFILILPLFVPPFTNSNGMLAYAVTLIFAIPQTQRKLLTPTDLTHVEAD